MESVHKIDNPDKSEWFTEEYTKEGLLVWRHFYSYFLDESTGKYLKVERKKPHTLNREELVWKPNNISYETD